MPSTPVNMEGHVSMKSSGTAAFVCLATRETTVENVSQLSEI